MSFQKGITRGAELVFLKLIFHFFTTLVILVAKCNLGGIGDWRNAVFEHLPKSSARVILVTFMLLYFLFHIQIFAKL